MTRPEPSWRVRFFDIRIECHRMLHHSQSGGRLVSELVRADTRNHSRSILHYNPQKGRSGARASRALGGMASTASHTHTRPQPRV